MNKGMNGVSGLADSYAHLVATNKATKGIWKKETGSIGNKENHEMI